MNVSVLLPHMICCDASEMYRCREVGIWVWSCKPST